MGFGSFFWGLRLVRGQREDSVVKKIFYWLLPSIIAYISCLLVKETKDVVRIDGIGFFLDGLKGVSKRVPHVIGFVVFTKVIEEI